MLSTDEAIERSEKKLRQADFFLGHLRRLTTPGRVNESMEFYLGASMTAAQSAFYVLDDNVSAFKQEHRCWRKARNEDDRGFLNRMIKLRDDDVHQGMVDATVRHTYVDAARVPGVKVLAHPDASVEMQNPDGTTIRAPVLMGSDTLYIEHGDRRIEAAVACQRFIALLRDLVQHFKHTIAAA